MVLKSKKVLVIGDFMLDVYTFGDVHRISPEAPVPVLRVTKEANLPGGAGNVILNLISLGMEVIAMGRVGEDSAGHTFVDALVQKGVDTRGILYDAHFQTPVKKRMIGGGQQIVRVDYENPLPLQPEFEQQLLSLLPSLLEEVDIVAISDYAKGFLTQTLLRALISMAKEREIPVVVDPKGIDFTRYHGATLIKPNLAEARSAAGLGNEATIEEMAARILHTSSVETLMVTRSNEGISIFDKGGKREDFPAHVHEVKDVTGAGDTVLAVITAALANQLTLSRAAQLANIAAGIAIERIGCVHISLAELNTRLVESHPDL